MDLVLAQVGVYNPVDICFGTGDAQKIHFFNHVATSWLLTVAYITQGLFWVHAIAHAFKGNGQTVDFMFFVI